MTKAHLLNRLDAVDPGWPIYRELVRRVEGVDFSELRHEFLGRFLVATVPLVFAQPPARTRWPDWMPRYVPALYGLHGADAEMEGGYARHFHGNLARRGAVFSPAANDEELGFPTFDLPGDVYHFQANRSGALFFVDPSNQVLYPDAGLRRLVVLDSLTEFTQNVIRAALAGADWFHTYADRAKGLVD